MLLGCRWFLQASILFFLGFVSQKCSNTRFQVTIEKVLRVTSLPPCSLILNHLVRVENIVSNLLTPGSFDSIPANFLDFCDSLFFGNCQELGLQPFHCNVLIHCLTTLLGTLHCQSCGQVLDSDRRVDLIHVLSTRSATSHGGDLYFTIGDIDLVKSSFVDKNGCHIHSRKSSLSFVVCIERRQPHQTVGSLFCLEPPIRVCPTIDNQFDTFIANHFSCLFILHGYGETHLGRVSFVHATKISNPIIGFSPSSSSCQENSTRLVIIWPAQ
mmetsp:Transcript_2478/g.5794  ORF Transcript_2478/g.5794 Transcript_2478/m.5794 type:complete len:270 (+) Transcript_2478:8063-8872(+)